MEEIRGELAQADKSLLFLGVLLGALLLSFRALLCQRQGLAAGRTVDVSPLRRESSVLVVLSLGYFFCLALQTGQDGGRSAQINRWASLLVLLAALLRLWDLLEENHNGPAA
ncbi:hypothetical protein [Pseudoflavonifractor phocaeensis]|uniref:hypothetical protein n=1 Tax=Pseudoflavonifractor phocaeensis TaxID=1870988 RepID=UPI00195B9A6A|nr:hypothetical protein [Pseudoflavonifractor phocaeensis]MBM6924842.1 hypothetical protein [Pseudoflavonifractor phocaeensis]